MIEAFENTHIELIPDIVFFLENKLQQQSVRRSGILVILRQDKESYFSQRDKEQLISYLKDNYKVTITDNTNGASFTDATREKRLHEFWNKFSTAQVVVTDRLHGMIFSAITHTPCVVARS